MIEVGKKYKVYAPNKKRLLDEVVVTKIEGTAFYCYSIKFDYDTAYDTSDGIILEEVGKENIPVETKPDRIKLENDIMNNLVNALISFVSNFANEWDIRDTRAIQPLLKEYIVKNESYLIPCLAKIVVLKNDTEYFIQLKFFLLDKECFSISKTYPLQYQIDNKEFLSAFEKVLLECKDKTIDAVLKCSVDITLDLLSVVDEDLTVENSDVNSCVWNVRGKTQLEQYQIDWLLKNN